MDRRLALYELITQPERERLFFLKAICDRCGTPPFYLCFNPRDHGWAVYWGFYLVMLGGFVLHLAGLLPWWLHMSAMAGYLAAIVAGFALFKRAWHRWLSRQRAASKCYHDYFTILARRYNLPS